MPSQRPYEILLVEDSPSDAFLIREAVRAVEAVDARVHVVVDGVEAMSFLRRRAPYVDAPIPDLVLLDLNLPRKDGREVLAEVKEDKDLRHIPVVVLTSSSADVDVKTAYGLHANCYVTKPTDFTQFRQAIERIETFWFKLVCLPPR